MSSPSAEANPAHTASPPAHTASPARIEVNSGGEYDVIIGSRLDAEIVAAVPATAARVAIIHPAPLRERANSLREQLAAAELDAISVQVPDGEAAKTVEVAGRCWHTLGQAGFTRSDAVIGIGGGATTDLAGFVAATWLRGIALIQVPTTLLAMVDAAVGGKTGINTATGKNLVGSFFAPRAVIADLTVLTTVPQADYVSGLAEVIKAGFIRDRQILDLIATAPQAAIDPRSPVTPRLIAKAVQVKADVVSADFREAAGVRADGGIGREMLNYGHTLAHAIERVEGYRWRHGAAVSVGMVFAAELAGLTGQLSDVEVAMHRHLLTAVGLPVSYRPGRWLQLFEAMAIDKKTRGKTRRFVILNGIGHPTVLEAPDQALLAAAYSNLRPEPGSTDRAVS